MLCPVGMSADVKGSGEGFDAIQSPRLSVIDSVRGDEVGQQSFAFPANLAPLNLLRTGPGALDHSGAVLVHELSISGGDDLSAVGGDDDSMVSLAHVKIAHHSQLHEFLP